MIEPYTLTKKNFKLCVHNDKNLKNESTYPTGYLKLLLFTSNPKITFCTTKRMYAVYVIMRQNHMFYFKQLCYNLSLLYVVLCIFANSLFSLSFSQLTNLDTNKHKNDLIMIFVSSKSSLTLQSIKFIYIFKTQNDLIL